MSAYLRLVYWHYKTKFLQPRLTSKILFTIGDYHFYPSLKKELLFPIRQVYNSGMRPFVLRFHDQLDTKWIILVAALIMFLPLLVLALEPGAAHHLANGLGHAVRTAPVSLRHTIHDVPKDILKGLAHPVTLPRP